jgi:hypothetical protein
MKISVVSVNPVPVAIETRYHLDLSEREYQDLYTLAQHRNEIVDCVFFGTKTVDLGSVLTTIFAVKPRGLK